MLPECLIADIRNVRKAAIKKLGGSRLTFGEAIYSMKIHEKYLKNLYKGFALDASFLYNHVKPLSADLLKKAVLDALPHGAFRPKLQMATCFVFCIRFRA